MPTGLNQTSSIQSLLHNKSEVLSALCYRASQISQLQEKLRNEISTPLSDHLFVANFNSEALTIQTDSPAWAARLRFIIPDILKIAKNSGNLNKLRSIRIKVSIPKNESNETKRKLSLTKETLQMIRETADSISDDKLRSALFRLANHR